VMNHTLPVVVSCIFFRYLETKGGTCLKNAGGLIAVFCVQTADCLALQTMSRPSLFFKQPAPATIKNRR